MSTAKSCLGSMWRKTEGQMTGADSSSRSFLSFARRSFVWEEVGLVGARYEITKYINATPNISIPTPSGSNSCSGRWIGYVVVATNNEVRGATWW
ncbi:phospholipase A1-Ialpha2, chloroplastic-like [Canna indica]|uniref:Phospholipase A1-Ialpha2, chloroplastic-like n=1 Tax=Canna indica TaxID=4628 RepID=A0AAQ3KSB5_9LILI|nr:phospholipase A1-Ialpha2, chloroplastic-like [Canna indica]